MQTVADLEGVLTNWLFAWIFIIETAAVFVTLNLHVEMLYQADNPKCRSQKPQYVYKEIVEDLVRARTHDMSIC